MLMGKLIQVKLLSLPSITKLLLKLLLSYILIAFILQLFLTASQTIYLSVTLEFLCPHNVKTEQLH